MTGDWFERGERVELEVSRNDGKWYVHKPEPDEETICIFLGDGPDDDADSVTAKVKKFSKGISSPRNYLTLELLQDRDEGRPKTKKTRSSQRKPKKIKPKSSSSKKRYPERKLIQFRGDGEVVSVEAEIDQVFFVDKDTTNKPNAKGLLKEPGTTRKVPFVVLDGVSTPYLEHGASFRFDGVTDHRYKRDNEIQVLVTNRTSIVER